MGQDLKFRDLNNFNYDGSSDSDSSTAPNSIMEEIPCNVLDSSKINKPQTSINTVAFSNSTNIQIGDRVVYNGPVTITQDASNIERDLNFSVFDPNSENGHNCSLRQKVIYGIVIVIVIVVLILGVVLAIKIEYLKDSNKRKNYEFKIIPREGWGARPPDGQIDPLKLPVPKVIINHTVMRNCYTEECCKSNLHIIQDYHMSKKFGDIGYNFVICNDGNVYEGVGWDDEGAHTLGQNRKSFGIALNGDFTNEVPNKNQISALFSLLDEGVRLGKLKSDYKVYGARQFSQTVSPGEALYQMMQTWDHWSDEI